MSEDPTSPSSRLEDTAPPQLDATEVARELAGARALLRGGQSDQARVMLRRLIALAPSFEEPWLQFLALDPPPSEEMELLQSFLHHHPRHRFAQAFRSRLHDVQIVAMLGKRQDPAPEPAPLPPPQRLGDYLITRHWVAPGQVEQAIQEQQQLKQAGIERRLGTILLMNGHLSPEQLAVALAEARATGFGEFGNYLVRTGVATPAQIGQALARQSVIAAENEREYRLAIAEYHKRLGMRLLGKRMAKPQRKPVPKLGEVMVALGLLTVDQVDDILRRRQTDFNASFEG